MTTTFKAIKISATKAEEILAAKNLKSALAAKCTENKLKKLASGMESGLSKTAIIRLLREAGISGNDANAERAEDLRKEFKHCSNECMRIRINARLSTPLSAQDFIPLLRQNGPKLALPVGTPAQRLAKVRRNALVSTAKECLRWGGAGGTKFVVSLTKNPEKVNYGVELSKVYGVYGGEHKNTSSVADTHKICVPENWRYRVQKKGLAILSGLMTLDASPLQSPEGIALYAAVWVEQSRGFDVRVSHGFIAVSADKSYHAETQASAISGITRKCAYTKKAAATVAALSLSIDAFITTYAACEVDVSLEDARKSGACEYGIWSWCNSVGIDMARGSVPMQELLTAYRSVPAVEVRSAALRAVRRGRREPMALAA